MLQAHLVVQNRHRIVHVRLLERPLRDRLVVGLPDKVKARGQAKAHIQRPDGRDKRPGLFRFRAAGLNFRQLCQTGQLRINGRAIVLQHDRENNGVCQTVRRIIQPAQRVRDAMDI